MIKRIILFIIYSYRRFISPWKGRCCRFFPSCSEYAYISIARYGLLKGVIRGLKRLLSCHPLNPGGVDLP